MKGEEGDFILLFTAVMVSDRRLPSACYMRFGNIQAGSQTEYDDVFVPWEEQALNIKKMLLSGTQSVRNMV